MAEDPWAAFNPQPAPQARADDPWAQFNPQPAPKPEERSVLRRALEAPIESIKESGQAIAKPFIPPKTKEELAERRGPIAGLGETGSAILSAAGAIPGAILSPVQSLVSSGLAAITPGEKTSEQKYQEWMPKVGTAFMGLGRSPGIAGAGKFPMPDPILERVKKVPAQTKEAEVGRFLESQATDPDKLRADLAAPGQEIVPGSQPTTHQLTGQLGQQERVAARTDPEMVEKFKQRQAAQNRARQEAFEGAEGTGSPAQVSQHLRNELNRENAANEQAIRVAEQQAFDAQQRLGAEYDPTVMGERMRREIEIAEAAARERERGLWEQVNPDGTLVADPAGIQAVERGIYSPARMTPTARAGVSQAEGEISNLIQNYGRYIPFQELTDLRSLVSTRMREERMARGANSPSFARLVRLRQGIEDALVSSVSDVRPEGVARGAGAIGAQERVQAASAATRERAQQFNPLRNITRSEAGEAYKMGPSSVPGKIVQPGAKGYDSVSNYLRAVGNDAGMSTVQDALLARVRAEVFDRAGTPQQAQNRLEGFFRRYGDTLRAIDERDGGAFSQQLRNAGGAQGAVEAAQLRQRTAQATQATDQFKKLTGLTEDADIASAVGNIFGKQDSVQRAAELMRRLGGNPAAQEGARRAVIQHMRNVLTGDVLVGDTPNVRAQAFQKYVRLNKPALQQILRPEQMETLELIARDLLRETRTNQTKAVGGGSDTYQMFKAGEKKEGVVRGIAKKLTSPLVGKVITHWLAGTFGGPAASVALAVGEGGIEAARAARAGRRAQEAIDIQRMIDEAMLDPAKAKEYLGKTHTYKARTPGAKAILGYEAGAAEKQRQQLPTRQTGGAVPALGGTGGRSPGAREVARSRQARPGSTQALQDGGEAGNQEARAQGGRERLGAALSSAGPFGGSPAGGGEMTGGTFKTRAKGPEPLTRQKVVDTLKQHGVTDPEVLKGWTEGWPHTAESRAEGGGVKRRLPEGLSQTDVDAALHGPGWERIPGAPEHSEAQRFYPRMRVNPDAWDARFGPRGDAPESTNIEDRRARGGSIEFLQGGGGTDPIPTPPPVDPTPPPTPEPAADPIAGSDLIHPPLPDDQNQQRKQQLGLVPGMFAEGGDVERSEPTWREMLDPKVLGMAAQMYLGIPYMVLGAAAGGLGNRLYGDPERFFPMTRSEESKMRRRERESPSPYAEGGDVEGYDFEKDRLPPPPGMAGGGLLRSGIESILMPTRRAATRGLSRPVRDLPQKTLTVGGEPFTPRPSPEVRQLAQQYMEEKGLPYRTLENYVPVDVPRAKAIAHEYDIMPHLPEDPSIQRAYDALARETRDQYEMLQRAGNYKFEPFKPGPVGSDPYAANPRLAQKDFLENKHMYYFPSEQGFGLPGEEAFAKANPMMAPSGVKIEGKEVPFNDLFRVVHDVFGHHKEGFGFRAAGEENAWRSHGRMYSPEALPAMTAETRGQNSWVNFGPHAEFNKTASGADTIYAPQKIGRLPDWIIHSGRLTPLGIAGAAALPEGEPERKQEGGIVGDDSRAAEEAREHAAARSARAVQPRSVTGQSEGRPGEDVEDPWAPAKRIGKAIFDPTSPMEWAMLPLGVPGRFGRPLAKAGIAAVGGLLDTMGEAEAGKAAAARKLITRPAIHTEPQMFDYSRLREVPDVPQFDLERYVPPRGVPETATSLAKPENIARINSVVRQGAKAGGLEWYNTMPLREAFIAELGPEQGPAAFARYMDYVASTSPHSAVPINVRNASYYYGLGQRGDPMPTMHIEQVLNKRGVHQPKWKLDEPLPSPYGHEAQTLHVQNATNVLNQGGIPLANQKPASFSQNLQGNWRPVTIDTHNARLIGLPRDAPSKTEYGFLEAMQQREAERLGMTPAQYQASAWIGGGAETGLRSTADPFLRVFEQRVRLTADKTGVPPEQVLRRFIRGEMPLLKFGGGV